MIATLVQQEQLLGTLPLWASELAEIINYLPFCPHASFPFPYLKVLDAIGSGVVPAVNHGCYSVDRARKDRMTDYIFCMDAWRAGASVQQAAAALSQHESSVVDWRKVCEDLWTVLGERSELKLLLISRILHRERWWVKTLLWDDDPGNKRMRDQYLGEAHIDATYAGDYGNPGFKDPYGIELAAPEVIRMEKELSETCPDWPAFQTAIHSTWLCGPKAFRFLEKLLWCVGKEKMVMHLPSFPLENEQKIPGFLQCADSYPDVEAARDWLSRFYAGIEAWLQDEAPQDEAAVDVADRLGARTELKVWLCGLFYKKLRMLAPFGCR